MFGNFGAALFAQVLPLWVGWFGWEAAILLCALGYLLGAVCWLPIHPDRPPDPPADDSDDRPAR
jgi:nitrate/nitrite transporter NarK